MESQHSRHMGIEVDDGVVSFVCTPTAPTPPPKKNRMFSTGWRKGVLLLRLFWRGEHQAGPLSVPQLALNGIRHVYSRLTRPTYPIPPFTKFSWTSIACLHFRLHYGHYIQAALL